jgi:outer membrane protein OmpA-like peptidoglycan-associated protein
MKKSYILALGYALLAGTAVAQNAQEVTYVEDPAQGYIFNSFSDNWFIQGEGGVAIGFTPSDKERKLGDRFAPAASLYVGKWFSPLLGIRGGADFISVKGLTDKSNDVQMGVRTYEPMYDNQYYKTKLNYFGPSFDVMLNLTNWWCGYRPGRVYNAYVYAGGGLYWALAKYSKDGGDLAWHNIHDRVISIRAGLTQEFNITKNFALGLDLRAVAISNHSDNWGRTQVIGEALLTATYKFNKTDWSAPVVPVCPVAENCDEYRARLAEADAKIADLENQLRACLNRPVEKVVEKVPAAPLATIYYPCNVSTLTSVDKKVLESVSNVMKDNSNKTYVLTGWADNYTGNDAINVRLRQNRVNGVKNQLVKLGVSESQLEATTNNGNRVDLGDKCLTLDRCVTIVEK